MDGKSDIDSENKGNGTLIRDLFGELANKIIYIPLSLRNTTACCQWIYINFCEYVVKFGYFVIRKRLEKAPSSSFPHQNFWKDR